MTTSNPIFAFFMRPKVREFFSTITFAFMFAFLFQTFLYQPFKIPSGSMKPNLQVGDYLFVEKFAYGYSNSSLSFMLNQFDIFSKTFLYNAPQRGDVVVFLLPKDHSIHYIKRAIGLPGDEIQMRNGQLYINDIPTKREYLGQTLDIDGKGNAYAKGMYQEILPNGVSYKIYVTPDEDKSTMPNETPIYKVPEGQYFFMGDNRDSSIDRRYLNDVGFVPVKNIVGKAKVIFWTSNLLPDLLTKLEINRAFKLIK